MTNCIVHSVEVLISMIGRRVLIIELPFGVFSSFMSGVFCLAAFAAKEQCADVTAVVTNSRFIDLI